MSLLSITRTLFRSSGQRNLLDLNSILGEEDQFFKIFGIFIYLQIEDLPQEVLIEDFNVNMQFLEHKA